MTLEETIDLLSVAGAFDRRAIGEADAIAWHTAISDLSFTDARQAVIAHYRERTDWIMPAHVRERVKEIRNRHLQDTEVPAPPPELLDDPDAYRQWLRIATKAIADGHDPQQATKAAVEATRPRPQLTAVPKNAS